MKKLIAMTALGILFATGWTSAAQAGNPPRIVWIKAKCALCHGQDGSGQTKQGKQTHTPDLRSADFQKISDADLRARIANGHGHMPSFRSALTTEQVSALVVY